MSPEGERPLLTAEALLRYLKPKQLPLNPESGLPQLPPKALLSFSPSLVKQIKGQLKEQLSFAEPLPFLGVQLHQISPEWMVVSGLGLGAPAAVARLEELRSCGVKEFIFLGSAGSLKKDLGPGQVLVCTKAIADEGTSQHYLLEQQEQQGQQHYSAHGELGHWLEQVLLKNSIDFVQGVSWTTDAPYRETQSKVDDFVKRGACVVDMEASALFAVGAFYGLKVAGVFVVSDQLTEGQWRPHFREARVKDPLIKVARAILEAGA